MTLLAGFVIGLGAVLKSKEDIKEVEEEGKKIKFEGVFDYFWNN